MWDLFEKMVYIGAIVIGITLLSIGGCCGVGAYILFQKMHAHSVKKGI